jgi:hypothetical protein
MLIAIYYMIKNNMPYRELGAQIFDQRSAEAKKKSLIQQLERLGFAVELHSA